MFHESIFPFAVPGSTPNLDLFHHRLLPRFVLDVVQTHLLSIPLSPSSSAPSLVNSSRPKCATKPPAYLADYHYSLATLSNFSFPPPSQTPYPLSSVLSYHHFSESHHAFSLAISSYFEPQYFSQANELPEWQATMKKELCALEENKTWHITYLPPTSTPLAVNRCTRPNSELMGLWKGIKHTLLLRDTHKGKVLI